MVANYIFAADCIHVVDLAKGYVRIWRPSTVNVA